MHYACTPHYRGGMPAVTIRNVPDETRNVLAARAARNGQSLQEFLHKTLVEIAAKPDLNELLDEVAAHKRAANTRVESKDIVHSLSSDRK